MVAAGLGAKQCYGGLDAAAICEGGWVDIYGIVSCSV
jgi:hypothetical protein